MDRVDHGPSREARAAARIGLYVHVPFCARRCNYCDFSTGSLSRARVERYLAAMDRETAMRAAAASGARFTSVFFGGGTPSALAPHAFRRLWAMVSGRFAIEPDAEITLEANPESVGPQLLDAWAAAGVNRLSMGVQSFDAEELRRLGRIHTAERPAEAVRLARAHGFRRLSLDLMFGFPGSGPERLEATLDRALALEPEHLSTYCFIPEDGTPLGDAVARGETTLPGTDAQADAYARIVARLDRAGYGCYETSNFCRPGGEARHNLVYWLRRSYVGLGPSAHGLWAGVRTGNHYALERWAAALEAGLVPESEHEVETRASIAEEVMMLGLRLSHGLAPEDHAPAVWEAVRERYEASFAAAVAARRLERAGRGVRIPAAARFVADDVIAWIDARAQAPRFDRRATAFIPSSACPSLHSPAA